MAGSGGSPGQRPLLAVQRGRSSPGRGDERRKIRPGSGPDPQHHRLVRPGFPVHDQRLSRYGAIRPRGDPRPASSPGRSLEARGGAPRGRRSRLRSRGRRGFSPHRASLVRLLAQGHRQRDDGRTAGRHLRDGGEQMAHRARMAAQPSRGHEVLSAQRRAGPQPVRQRQSEHSAPVAGTARRLRLRSGRSGADLRR